MNKQQLIEIISSDADVEKRIAEKVINSFTKQVEETCKSGKDKLVLVGFGTFSAKHTPARKGRNPQTGESLQIGARYTPQFKPGSKLKEAVNGK